MIALREQHKARHHCRLQRADWITSGDTARLA
jgi:hypothetical protein